MLFQEDKETLVEFADGNCVRSAYIENFVLIIGVYHPVRALVVELAS
jgi:hypothetical protein